MIIKSSESLCKNYEEFSRLVHLIDEPIYITKEGEGDMVILSIESYEKLYMENSNKFKMKKIIKGDENMTTYKLGLVLKEMYNASPRGQQVTNIHTFAIYYANIIEGKKINKKEILKIAGLPESYQTEISKGINLALYVDVKETQKDRIRKIEEELSIKNDV